MGQANNGQSSGSSDYVILREVPNGSIVREAGNGKLHFVKEYSFTNQESYQQAFVNFSKKLPQKHEHILYLERTNTKVENTFCSTFYKISLLYEYLDHTLEKEIRQRLQQKKVFDEKEVWSVLCSCALAVSQMIRFEGRSHSALKAKDLRLTNEGVVKILSLEMVGMDSDHDSNHQGSVKQLALTILNCILMEDINNDSEEFLLQVIDTLDSSPEMKNILRIMLNPSTRFVDLEEYLFKLVQEDSESLNSYSNTPIIKEKTAKNMNSYSRIPEQSKEDDSLINLPRDFQDNPQNCVYEPQTEEQEIPDENSVVEDNKSKAYDSQRGSLRDKNEQTPSSQKNLGDSKRQFIYSSGQQQNSLFTDPKLLNLIHSNLQQINKRKSVANSRKIGFSDSSSKFQKSDSKQIFTNIQNDLNTHSSINIGVNQNIYQQSYENNLKSSSAHNSMANLTSSQTNACKQSNGNITNQMSNSNTKSNHSKENENSRVLLDKNSQVKQVKSSSTISLPKSEEGPVKSQKNIAFTKTNPEDRKSNITEKKYDNIMQMQQMGFKKNKVKTKQQSRQQKQSREDIRVTFNPSNSNVNTVVYNSNISSTYNSNTMPLSNNYFGEKQNHSADQSKGIQYSFNEPRQQFEYVSQTYLKGRYEGTKMNGMRHGKGVFYYNEGGKYIGQWRQNKMDGKGILYYPNNQIAYDGEWKEDQLQGYGTLYNEEVGTLNVPFDYKNWEDVDEYWIKYEGNFIQDCKNGQGKLFLSNGEVFEGNFKEDMVWGEGILMRRDGTRVRGIWKENKLIKLY